MELPHLLAAARGDRPADLLLRNAGLVNVFSGEVLATEIAIAGGVIAGFGRGYDALEDLDLEGRFVAPGFLDAHVHIESSMVTPAEFERLSKALL